MRRPHSRRARFEMVPLSNRREVWAGLNAVGHTRAITVLMGKEEENPIRFELVSSNGTLSSRCAVLDCIGTALP